MENSTDFQAVASGTLILISALPYETGFPNMSDQRLVMETRDMKIYLTHQCFQRWSHLGHK